MASISSAGVGSGIDLDSLLQQVVSAEREPVKQRLDLEEAEVEAEISAMGNLKQTVAAFQDALQDLKNPGFFSSRSAASSDSSLFTATAGTTADLSNYTIEVFEQAGANKIVSDTDFSSPTATAGSGTLTISQADGGSFDVAVAADDSIADIRDAINSASGNPGVSASLITVDAGAGDGSTVTKFVLTSNSTGADGQIDISVSDDDGNNTDGSGLSRFFYDGANPLDGGNQFSQIDAAQDARIAVDGFTAYSSTNTFDNVIDDVSITVVDEADDPLNPPSGTLSVSADKSQVTAAVETFVATYNELTTVFNKLTNYDEATGTAGLLSGDAVVNGLESSLRRIMNDTVDGASEGFNALAFIGVATNRDGSISLDSGRLSEVVNQDFDQLAELFSGDDGIATNLDARVENALSFGGTFDNRTERLENSLRDISEQRQDLALRIDKIRARYQSQFAALDSLVSQLNSTGDFLQQQLSASAQIVNRTES